MDSYSVDEDMAMHANGMILNENMRVDWKGREAVIRTAKPDFIVLEFENNKKDMIDGDVAYDAYLHGELTLVESKPSVVYMPLTDPIHIKEANRLNAYLKELDSRAHNGSKRTRVSVIDCVSKRINDLAPLSEGSLYRLRKKWLAANKNVIPLIIKPKLQRKKQIEQVELDLAYGVIDDEYLKRNGTNVNQTYICFKNRFAAELKDKLKKNCMCKESFYKLIRELEPSEVILAREGKDALRRAARSSKEIIITDRMMQRVEIDAVHLNLGLLDDDGNYLGTVILYLAIDVHSRYIVGYQLRYGINVAEESAAVIELLKHISLPKKRSGNYQSTWYDLGVPTETFGDAGAAFSSNVVIAFSAMLGSSHTTTQAGSPWKKPFIERFNRTLRSQFATKIPGYFGRRVDGKTLDGTIEQKACVTVADFTKYLEEYICDYYHQSPHKGLNNQTPQQVVESELEYFKRKVIPDVGKVEACTGVERTATIQKRNGIQVNRLSYHSDELQAILNKLSMQGEDRKVKIIYNVFDISKITVIDPGTMTLVVIPCRDKRIKPGTSLKAYKAGLPVQNEQVKAFPSKHNDHKTSGKGGKTGKKSAANQPREVSSNAYKEEDLDQMIEQGKSRFGRDHTNKPIEHNAGNNNSALSESSNSIGSRRSKSKVV